MVFSELHLENYRGFERYRLSGLARVNLLVGRNNSGKTSILEAVQILASHGDPRSLAAISTQRGESIVRDDEDRMLLPDISHLFRGHIFEPDDRFRIASETGSEEVIAKIVHFGSLNSKQQFLFEDMATFRRTTRRGSLDGSGENLALLIEGRPTPDSPLALPITTEGGLIFDRKRVISLGNWMYDSATSVQFITPDSLEFGSMRQMWNRLISDSREGEIISSLKILDPNLASIFYLPDSGYLGSSRSKFLVGFDDPKRKRVPLGSFGEGMRRLLALSLALNQTQGGILLVDEIETGLHYSVLGEMWLLVVNAAIQYDLQVFATTHSLDCIRGLAWLCENHPHLAGEVSVQKIDGRLDEAVALDSRKLRIAVDQDLEVR